MVDAAARDAVWLDVLPSMRGFAPALAKGAGEAADQEGKKVGSRFGTAMLAGLAVIGGGVALATKSLNNLGRTFADIETGIATQTGAAGAELDGLVEAAKRVGSSVPVPFEQVGEAVASVKSSIGGIGDLTEEEFDRATTNALNFSRAFEIDLDRSTQVAGQLLKTGLAKDAEEAFDLMTVASQKVPANVREDLLDAMDEYGPFFSQLGLSGEEAFSALVAASDKGVFGIDKTGDALKEFTIRATDMSATSGAAYEALGLDQEEMTAKLLKGGEEGAKAFDQIVNGLKGIKDPVEQSQAALALFGTPLEDLGTENIPTFIDSLTNTESVLGEVGGAAKRLGDDLNSGPAASFEILKNKLLVGLSPAADATFKALSAGMTWILETGVPGLRSFGGWVDKNKDSLAALGITVGAAVLAFGGMAIVKSVTAWITMARAAVLALNAALRANPIGVVITIIGLLVAALIYLYQNNETARRIIDAAWGRIKGVIDGVVRWFRDTALPWFRDALRAIGDAASRLYRDYMKPAWDNITGSIRGTVNWVRGTAWPGFKNAFDSIASKATDLKNKAVRAWEGITSGLGSAWKSAKGILKSFRDGLQGLQDKVGSVKDGIGRVWSHIGGVFAKPINSVIDTVNRFLDNLESKLNQIPGVNLSLPSIPHVPVPVGSTSSGSQAGRTRGSGSVAMAAGGVLPGYSPGRDNMHFYSPDHGWLHLAGGEPVMRPEFGRAVGRGWIDRMNAAARTGGIAGVRRAMGFARGGTIPPQTGGKLGDMASAAGGWLAELFMNPGKVLRSLADKALSGLGNSWPAQAALGLVRHSMGKLAEWAKNKLFGGESGGGGGSAAAVGPRMGWRSIWALVKGLFPEAILTSSVRNSIVAGYGTKSLHASGRAVDFVLSPRRMIQATQVLSKLRRWTELIHTPAGMWQQNRGANFANFLPITKANHMDHVHAGLSSGGIIDPARAFVADSGALIPQGLSVLNNKLGHAEPLRRADLPTDLSPETIEELRDVFAQVVGELAGSITRHARQEGD